LKAWPVLGILFIESIIFSAHWFIYHTLIVFLADPDPIAIQALRGILFLFAFSFVPAALLSFRFSNPFVRGFYKVAAVWLGFLNYFFLAACFVWPSWLALQLTHASSTPALYRPLIVTVLFASAVAIGLYGLLNARLIRVRRIPIQLANLPASWRGRTALVMSDLHLGHINAVRFSRRVAALVARQQPDVVFIAGDFFDGTKTEPDRLADPFKQLAPPLGIYFSTGNHDEFGDTAHFLSALKGVGVHVLSNEKVIVDGLQILGVPYHDTTYPIRLRANLEALKIDRTTASILLSHVPNRLPIVEEAGVTLQLSGHTHGGQLAPYTWLTRRIFGKFTHGLNNFGSLQVYTSFGAGTWGPPMRIGTTPEVVLLTFK
jgi:uncharacterized protein